MSNYIAIDGLIGVGKSTLCEILKEKGYQVIAEPYVENPLLEKFYQDRKRYSFPSQIYFLNKKFEYMKGLKANQHLIIDRSIHGDYTFAKTLMEIGDMEVSMFELYDELYKNMLNYISHPKLLIFLDISTENAINRIKKRGRSYEQDMDTYYLDTLNKVNKDYFSTYNYSPILNINVDGLDFENSKRDRENILHAIDKQLEVRK